MRRVLIVISLTVITAIFYYLYTQKNRYVDVLKLSKDLAIVRDKNSNIYLRTKINKDYGAKYFYEDKVTYINNNLTKIVNIDSFIDLKSLKYNNTKGIETYLEDKLHTYHIIHQLCSHSIYAEDKLK